MRETIKKVSLKKRIFAMMCAMCMFCAALSMSAFADVSNPDVTVVESTVMPLASSSFTKYYSNCASGGSVRYLTTQFSGSPISASGVLANCTSNVSSVTVQLQQQGLFGYSTIATATLYPGDAARIIFSNAKITANKDTYLLITVNSSNSSVAYADFSFFAYVV